MSENPMLPAGYDILWSAVTIAIIVLAVSALVSLARTPRSGGPVDGVRGIWALAIIFLPILGALAWFVSGRSGLRQVDAK